ncbi:MAG: hypothetical protein QOG59_337 [Solirubrobacteraceae bacterium]|jgi:hypothetical protein|nr:hypothetical protein [Solirubrobacteraceae bacterium]
MTQRPLASASVTALRNAAAAIVLSTLLVFITPALASAAGIDNFNRETYSYSSSLSLTSEAGLYQVMVLQSTDGALVHALHAANPALKILVYQHPYFSRASDPAAWSTCTSYQHDLVNHPNWFLHTASGQFVTTRGGGNYEMDPANPAYQQACLANAVHLAKTYGFDGVFLDDIAASSVWDLPAGVTPAAYPSNAAFQGAMTSLLNAASATLHANGLLVFGNLCGTVISPGLWQKWAAMTDGSEQESWTDPGTGIAADTWAWPHKLADIAWSEAHSKYTLLHSYNTSQSGGGFGLASMLLVAGGWSSYSTSNANYTSAESWYPEYTTAHQLGAPIGPYSKLANGVYSRKFQNGIVLVNPTAAPVASFSLGGGTYSSSGFGGASTLSMPATSDAILLNATPSLLSAPVATASPAISASPVVSTTVNAIPKFTGTPTPTYGYQWSRCTSTACSAIPGATGAGYVVQSADVGNSLRVAVTAVNSAGRTSANSSPSAIVPTPTFTLSASPSAVTVRRWSTGSFMITVTDHNGFTGFVTMSQTGNPPRGRPTFSPLTTATSTVFSVGTSTRSVGRWPIRITGTSGGRTASVTVMLTVT